MYKFNFPFVLVLSVMVVSCTEQKYPSHTTKSLSQKQLAFSIQSKVTIEVLSNTGKRFAGRALVPLRIAYKPQALNQRLRVHSVEVCPKGTQIVVKRLPGSYLRRWNTGGMWLRPHEIKTFQIPSPIIRGAETELIVKTVEVTPKITIKNNRKKVSWTRKRGNYRVRLAPTTLATYPKATVIRKAQPLAPQAQQKRQDYQTKRTLFEAEVQKKLQGDWKILNEKEKRKQIARLKYQMLK